MQMCALERLTIPCETTNYRTERWPVNGKAQVQVGV
jgi:hypothetical protein